MQRSGLTRAVSFPAPLPYNPYQAALHEALRAYGIEVAAPTERLSPLWVLRHNKDVDVVHLHWLEILAFDPGRRWATLLDYVRGVRLLVALAALKRSRLRVVWTVHNAFPHEPRHRWLYAAIERTARSAADAVIVHSDHAAARVSDRLSPRSVVRVAYHGSYRGSYPDDTRDREAVRAAMDLPTHATVFLVFGMLRRYKRVPEILEAFSRSKDPMMRLVVAGSCSDDELRAAIERRAAVDDRIHLHLRWIDDHEISGLHLAADAAVLNYPEIFSSGALMLAWSFDLPVIAPVGGTVEELTVPGAAVLFEEGQLADALAEARAAPDVLDRATARSLADKYSWDAMAREVAAAYREVTR
jgi:beta-1,4-mannosyltransferase